MVGELVRDRYICEGDDRWIDLVTGDQERAHGPPLHIPASADIRAAIEPLVALAASPHVGIRVAEMTTQGDGRLLAEEAGRALQPAGFVTVRSTVRLAAAISRPLLSRHVVVIAWNENERESAVWWVRQLTRRSPRGHLVLLLSRAGPARPVSALRVIEARIAEGAGDVSPPAQTDHVTRAVMPWLARAGRLLRRGRTAAGERWLTAALAAARRRGDEGAMVHAGREVIRSALERGRHDRAAMVSRWLMDVLRDRVHRERIAAEGVAALIAGGELDRAEALLSGVTAEAALCLASVSACVSARWVELLCWRGRLDEATEIRTRAAESHPEWSWWLELCVWLRGARDDPDECLERLAKTLDQTMGRARASVLRRAICAERNLASGRADRARAIASDRRDRRDRREGGPLDRLLLAWLGARAGDRGPDCTSLSIEIRRLGAGGITRWGRGADAMQLVHGLPALTHLVQDADDELGALRGSCGWVKQHAGADRIGIVSAESGAFVVSEGWIAADLATAPLQRALQGAVPVTIAEPPWIIVSAPVRHSRVVIGRVVARAREDSGSELEPAVVTLAALIAPALRTRLDAQALVRDAHARAPEILGHSLAMTAIREAVARAAVTMFPVLIEGESGTGKELVARALHRLSPRRDRSFQAINCAALTDELVEAELFGHTRGAFTGAVGVRVGLFEQAQGGTLFLDEVSELSLRAQAKLLRALQEREIRRVGENAARVVDVRLVAATNAPLDEGVRRGVFREDLMFRLAVIRIRMPPLRDRLEDVAGLAQAFWRQMLTDTNKRAVLGPDAIAALHRHSWPGNVRELQNAMASLAVIAPARGRVSERHVHQVLGERAAPDAAAGVPLDEARQLFERRLVAAALARHGGRRSAAAQELGLSRQGLSKALRRLGLGAGEDSVGVA